MKQTYHLHVVENAATIAKEAGIELMMPDTTEMTLEIPDKAIPDKTGIYLGKCVNGVYTSNIEKDDEECNAVIYMEVYQSRKSILRKNLIKN